jgi:8-oxo-(d)GTP phosphatase
VARLLLVRHARAGRRGLGPEDLERPLDVRGEAQAEALPALLAPHLDGVVTVRSSPAVRCVATVEPLARSLGTELVVDGALVEGSDARLLLPRLATLAGTEVWSSHGDVIPELLMLLARRGLDLGTDPSCRKGSTWVIDVEDAQAMRATPLEPPA